MMTTAEFLSSDAYKRFEASIPSSSKTTNYVCSDENDEKTKHENKKEEEEEEDPLEILNEKIKALEQSRFRGVNFRWKVDMAALTEEREILLEEHRVEETVKSFIKEGIPFSKERHDVQECPVCSEDFVYEVGCSLGRATCCGKTFCNKCYKSWDSTCPYCRTNYPATREGNQDDIREHAKAGKPWAQLELYKKLEDEEGEDSNVARQWLEKAANQGDPEASYILGNKCMNEGSVGKGVRLLKTAAIGRFAKAPFALALCLKNIPGRYNEAVRWNTFAAAQGYPIYEPQLLMGMMWNYGGEYGHTTSLERAIYWYKKALEQEGPPPSPSTLTSALKAGSLEYTLSGALMELATRRYGNDFPRGHDVSPEVYFWIRQASSKGHLEARSEQKRMLEFACLGCSVCNKPRRYCPDNKLMRCSKCKLESYCSRECQKKAWTKGHKKDCYPPAGK